MDPIGMLIWGGGLVAVGILLIVIGFRWRSIGVLAAVTGGLACLSVGAVEIAIGDDDVPQRWAALPAAAIGIVVVAVLVAWVKNVSAPAQ